MCDYSKLLKTRSKTAIDKYKELEKENARLAAMQPVDYVPTDYKDLKLKLEWQKSELSTLRGYNSELRRRADELREKLSDMAIKSIDIIAEMRKV